MFEAATESLQTATLQFGRLTNSWQIFSINKVLANVRQDFGLGHTAWSGCISNKYGARAWTELISLRMGTSRGLLSTPY
jgi:hypothetical protein